MRYLVYRLDTKLGPHYQIAVDRHQHRSRAICVGDLEAPSRRIAALLLRDTLRQALKREDRFFPGPAF